MIPKNILDKSRMVSCKISFDVIVSLFVSEERYEGQIFALFGKTYIFILVEIYRVNLLMNSLFYILHTL